MPGPSNFSENDIVQLRKLITDTEAAGSVVKTAQGFEISPAALAKTPLEYRQMLQVAVARANCDTVAELAQSGVATAGIADVLAAVGQVAGQLGFASDMVNNVKIVIDQGTPSVSWSGVAVELPVPAASALAQIVGVDLNRLLAALIPVAPKAAVVLAVTGPAGAALKQWIASANRPKGVRIELLLWMVPWVSTIQS